MNIRRPIIFAYVLCATFLMAHIVNAVIAETLSVPTGLIRPSPASDQAIEASASAPVLVERIRASGLFPLPVDPLGISATGPAGSAGSLPSRAPLNLASKLALLGVVMGDLG
jgi:hypothetical protein